MKIVFVREQTLENAAGSAEQLIDELRRELFVIRNSLSHDQSVADRGITYVCMYACMYMCMYTCMCVCTNILLKTPLRSLCAVFT